MAKTVRKNVAVPMMHRAIRKRDNVSAPLGGRAIDVIVRVMPIPGERIAKRNVIASTMVRVIRRRVNVHAVLDGRENFARQNANSEDLDIIARRNVTAISTILSIAMPWTDDACASHPGPVRKKNSLIYLLIAHVMHRCMME